MKIHLHFIFFFYHIIFLAGFSFAQTTASMEDTSKTKVTKWGVGLQVSPVVDRASEFWDDAERRTYLIGYGGGAPGHIQSMKDRSYSIGFLYNYYFENNMIARLRFGLTNVNNTSYDKDTTSLSSGFFSKSVSVQKLKNYTIEISVMKELREKTFGFYGGGGIIGKLFGTANFDSEINMYNDTTNALLSTTNYNTTCKKQGWALGIGTFCGARFYIKHFVFGPEFSFAFLFNKYGGEETSTINNQPYTYRQQWFYFWNTTPVYGSINIFYFF